MDADSLFAAAAAKLVAGDLAPARDLFRRAGDAGRRDAAVIHCNLLASGGDWPAGLALLRGLAAVDRRCRTQLDIVEAMDLEPNGDPLSCPAGERLSEAPHLTFFRSLFSEGECAYLIGAATPMLEPSVVVDPATGRQRPDPVRVSDGIGFTAPLENPAVHALNRRIAAASGTKVAQGEPLQVLRYRPGGEYRPHFDAMLVWLNAGYAGGETMFMKPGLKLRGAPGDALLFRNARPDGSRDDDAAHAGLPVTQGEKLIASRWIRARPFELA